MKRILALPFSLAADVYIRRASISQGAMHAGYAGQGDWLFRPLHLWFLEYVFLFCGVALVLSKVKFKFRGDSLLRMPEALLLGAVLTAGVVLLLGEP